jgi:hypothetical protein
MRMGGSPSTERARTAATTFSLIASKMSEREAVKRALSSQSK